MTMFRFFHRHPMMTTLTLVVLVSSPGYWRQEVAIDKAEHATEQLVVQRSEARRIACEKDERFAEAHNALVESHNVFVVFLATGGGTREIRPEDKPLIEGELKRNNKNLVTVPDCSPEGLAALPGEPDAP